MNLRDLEYIAAVARAGSFRKAAEACYASQPTLSAQIAKVERELGLLIFERRGRRLALTPEGVAAVRQIQTVLEEVQTLRQLGKAAQQGLSGAFAVGLIPTLGPYLMRRLLPLFRDEFPAIQLHLREERTAVLLDRLAEGQLDVAFVATHPERAAFRSVPLFREDLLLAVPRKSALAKRETVTPKDLDTIPYIELEEGHCLREDSVVQCRLSRQALRSPVQATSLESARQMVMAGIGATIMPRLAIGTGMDDGRLVRYVPFGRPRPRRGVFLLYRARAANVRHLEALALRMQEFFQQKLTT